MTYATLELMRALQGLNIEVTNFAAGRKHFLKAHCSEMQKYGFQTISCPLPRKFFSLSNKLKLNIENLFLKPYDFFIQIGLHENRHIAPDKYILFIHDTVALRYPDGEKPFPAYTSELLNRCRLILTVSEFSKKEMVNFFKLDPEKIKVVPNGCDLSKFKPHTKADQEKIKAKYRLPEKFFVAYGGSSLRKNVNFLLKTYSDWKVGNKPGLVLFGNKPQNLPDSVISLGYIEDNDVPRILSAALALLFPSYYEGFGLPVLEAFACGLPVICANTSSLPEVSAGNALFFDPQNGSSLISQLSAFLSDPLWTKKLSEKGLELVKNKTWTNSGEKLLACLKDLL